MPQKWGFSPICDPPRFFFKNRALSLLYPYGALTSCKKLEKSLERSLRYLKTDYGRTDGRTNGQGRLLRTPSGKPGVQKEVTDSFPSHLGQSLVHYRIFLLCNTLNVFRFHVQTLVVVKVSIQFLLLVLIWYCFNVFKFFMKYHIIFIKADRVIIDLSRFNK